MSTDLLLAPGANTAVTNLIAVASEQLRFAFGWKGDLEKFCSTMEILRGVLQDAEERNLICGRLDLKRWIEKLRAVADEAEDVMEEVAYKKQRRLVVDLKPKWKKVGYFFTSNPLVFHLRIGNKVKNLNSSLLEIKASADPFGLQTKLAVAVPVPLAQPPPTDSSPPPQFVGRDEDVLKIESLLVESTSQQDLPVIAIVGMPGLGKTTLAKEVFRTDKIREKFGQNVIWVSVSKSFDPERILKDIFESLGGGAGDTREVVVRGIREKLDGKNYLLILDDVWNEDRQKWERLRKSLLGLSGLKGNMVLVTTRSEEVASIMTHREEDIYRPGKLEDDECWTIIKQRVFGSFSVRSDFGELEAVGKEISRKCKGVPLVASLIGAMLPSENGRREWQSMLENQAWQTFGRENGFSDTIKFSYDRLPGHALKQCFAFCSIFPEDYIMEKDVLIQLWMAEGFLQPSEESSEVMEDVGDKYFRHLLSYSLFQENERDDLGRVISCTMHDLIHDFAKSLSKSESVVLKEEAEKNISNQTRHLNLMPGGEVLRIISRDGAPKLRTLLFSEQDTCDGVQLDSKRLRVLHVSKASDAKQLSKCFGKSKSLRYLDISGTEMKEFPKFIKKLYHLQTFRLMDCESLQMPPEGLRDLINLGHIYFSDEERMPANLGSLTNLQTLEEFYVGETKGRKIEELGSLRKLRGRLTVYNLELVKGKSEAESARLHEKALDELRLDWSICEDRDGDKDVLEGLLPHSSLQKLYIHDFGGMCLPSWMLKSEDNRLQFNSLVVLEFISCKKLKSIPVMEVFSSLKELSIKYCEELSDGAFAFQSLKELSIWDCPNVESFSFSGLTSLEELKIYDCGVVNITGDGLSSCTHLRILKLTSCNNLKNVPDLHGLSSLREVLIERCRELACLPSGWSSCTALEVLSIQYCRKLSSFPEEMLGCLSKLKRLEIGGFSNEELEEFPGLSSINNNLSASLEELVLIGWEKLAEVPSQIQALTALKELVISGFNGVEALPEWLGEFSSLKSLHIYSCSGLRSLESGLPSCTSLENLVIQECNNLVSLPVELNELRSLVDLYITRCPKLRSFPEEMLGGLTRLKRLEMGPFCEDLEEFIGLSSIHHLHASLEVLILYGWEKLAELPQQIQHLTALRRLEIDGFEGMEALPDWLAENLPSLQSLGIWRCPKLNKTLPSAQLIKRLSKLNRLTIFLPDWPELEGKIEQEKRSAAR